MTIRPRSFAIRPSRSNLCSHAAHDFAGAAEFGRDRLMRRIDDAVALAREKRAREPLGNRAEQHVLHGHDKVGDAVGVIAQDVAPELGVFRDQALEVALETIRASTSVSAKPSAGRGSSPISDEVVRRQESPAPMR